MNGSSLGQILDRLKAARQLAIFTHHRPDPDALGSQNAAAHVAHHLGVKNISLIQFEPPPGPYKFLLDDAPGQVVMWNASAPPEVDTVLLVDTCTYQQLEPAQDFLRKSRSKILAVDHHASRDDIGEPQLLYTDTTASACAEIIWELAHAAKTPMTAGLSQALLAGLVGDTGWFRFDSVRPRTHMMAAELVQQINPAQLYERLMQNETKPKLGLMQRALASLHWSFGDRYAAMMLRQRDFAETGAALSQTEYLVDMPMMVGTAEVVGLLTELADGRIRVSLRSKRDVNVNKICNQFGGGGHARAAGCRLDGPIEPAEERLRHAVGAALG